MTSLHSSNVDEIIARQFQEEEYLKKEALTSHHTFPLLSTDAELLDPCPDIYVLFCGFSEAYFWNKLIGVEVGWSQKMTLCAGMCHYEGYQGMCSIRLSEPLLKFRPRSDLVNTLLVRSL
jgi:hypothetical protein